MNVKMTMFVILTTLLCLVNDVSGQNSPPIAEFYGIDRRIPENTRIGEVVFSVSASDPDSPQSSLSLRLDSNTFRLSTDGPQGNVTLIKTLNFEATTSAEFVLTVSDGESETTYRKIIQIQDVNDVQPRFSQLRYQQHVPELCPIRRTCVFSGADMQPNQKAIKMGEGMKLHRKHIRRSSLQKNATIGTRIFSDVTVTDLDVSNSNLEVVCTYSSAFPDACNIFYINTTVSTNTLWIGDVYLRQTLDYEVYETYQLHLTAKDGNVYNDYLMNFEVVIDDVTDAPPFFTATFDARINEDLPLNSYVLTVVAEDGDKQDQRPIRYTLIENPGGLFEINSVTGDVATAQLLDINSEYIGLQGTVILNVTAQELLSDGSLGADPTTQSFADVRITIVDVNNNPPSFTQTHYSVNMSESLQNGQAIPDLTMYVSDADGADNAFFKFVFADLRDYEDIFRISPPEAQGSATATIVISNSSAIDYDYGLREYTLEVIAREVRTNSNLSSTAVVTIYVQDANDNAPKFNVREFTIRDLSELTQPGELIATLPLATDIDTGVFGTAGIVYSLIGFGNNRFEVDRLTGDLKLRQCSIPGTGNCLDYESVRQYNLSLIATDNSGTGHETRIPLTISILDENDNIPEFTSNSYQYRVGETSITLSTEQPIYATDRDSSRNGNNRIRYSLVTDRSQLFIIDSVTGALSLNRPIQFRDGDENGRLRITVGAGNLLDGASQVDFTRNTSVEILVDDINNNAPRFSRNYSTQILENIRPDIEIIRVEATDDDFGINAAIEYSIVSGAEGVFNIDINSGVISRRSGGVLDFDTRPRYNIQVKATDKGNPRLSGYATVLIDIIDDNNKNPVFSPPTTYANVSEDAALDFAVVSMQAIDRDTNADLRYSFTGAVTAYSLIGQLVNVNEFNYTELFRIDSGTGQVFVNQELDITKVQRIIYTVQAVDTAASGPPQIGTGTLIIDILNANIHPPEFENLDKVHSVLEEQVPGSLVTILTATDGDHDLVTYEIVDQSIPNVFSIQTDTGIVTVASRIDYEDVQMINFTVRASDGNAGTPFLSTDQMFTVGVININDNTPRFSQPYYEAQISENTTGGQTVTTVLASDLDLPPYGDVKYRLSPTVTEFRIDEVSGVISKVPDVLFDREAIKEIYLPVIAYDGPGTPSRSAIAPVYIQIKDVNDNIPYFTEDNVYITLSNEFPVGSSVTRLHAFDNDISDTLSYSIDKDPSGRYEISSSGEVTTRQPLTTAPDHTFDVRATDEAGNYAVVHVHIAIIGNKRGPKWIFPSFDGDKIVVCENQQIGELVNSGRLISATGAVRYSFVTNGVETDNLDGIFRLIPQSGEIITMGNVDREHKDRYLVQVLSRDADGLISQRYLLIEICDENDHHPEFPSYNNGTVKSFNFYIESGLIECVKDPVRNNACGQVTATDLDVSDNARIIYSITDGDGAFVINPDTGIITPIRGLDHNIQSLYSIQVTANNYRVVNGQRVIIVNSSSRKTANVYIHVLPVSTNPPLIRDVVNLYTSIDTQIGKCLDSMRPAGMTVDVKYTIRTEQIFDGNSPRIGEQDGRQRFSIGPQTGTICTIRLFNPSYAGFHYRIDVDVVSNSGDSGSSSGHANIWLTENIHKIRIVIDGDVNYVNSHQQEILEALSKILNTEIIWIDSVGRYTTKEGSIDSSRSNVIIYAVNETSRYLYKRNETITYINERVRGVHRSTALSAKIIGAEDITTTYIYLMTPTALPSTGAGGGGIPGGLLAAMLLLLPLLLLPFLLCCLLCCPCCAPLFGGGKGRKEKYVVLGGGPAAGGYKEASYIDDWYEQSQLYNNPAYVDENWDSGSAHLLVDANTGLAANGAAITGAGGTAEEVTEETEEYYHQDVGDGRGMGNGAGMAREAAVWDNADCDARIVTQNQNTGYAASAKAESAVIVDTLTPADAFGDAETVLVEEERTEHRRAEESKTNSERIQPLMTSMVTDQHQMSSLSPATLDILDSASTYNAKVAARKEVDSQQGHFSHTVMVPRYGNRYPPESDDYMTSESYESDYQSDNRQRRPSRTRYQEETGMTIVLDPQPSMGMEVEQVEYEVLTIPNGTTSQHSRGGGYTAEHSSVYRGGHSGGTIPRAGFTIELDPDTGGNSGMVADREEYVLDDQSLAPEFYAEAPRSPNQHKRYKKTTTTRTTMDNSGTESGQNYY